MKVHRLPKDFAGNKKSEYSHRFKLKCEELQQQQKDLTTKFEAFEEDKKDIVEFLKHSLMQLEDERDMLKEQLENLIEEIEKERESMQLQTLEMTKDLRERAEKLTAENEALGEVQVE